MLFEGFNTVFSQEPRPTSCQSNVYLGALNAEADYCFRLFHLSSSSPHIAAHDGTYELQRHQVREFANSGTPSCERVTPFWGGVVRTLTSIIIVIGGEQLRILSISLRRSVRRFGALVGSSRSTTLAYDFGATSTEQSCR